MGWRIGGSGPCPGLASVVTRRGFRRWEVLWKRGHGAFVVMSMCGDKGRLVVCQALNLHGNARYPYHAITEIKTYEGILTMISRSPKSCLPTAVSCIAVGPISHLPPLGTHSPPRALAMIWCPKQKPGNIVCEQHNEQQEMIGHTNKFNVGLVLCNVFHIFGKPVDPLCVFVCRGFCVSMSAQRMG